MDVLVTVRTPCILPSYRMVVFLVFQWNTGMSWTYNKVAEKSAPIRRRGMKPAEVAQKCFEKFNQLTMDMSDEDRWAVAEELMDPLEMVLSERTEKQIRDDAY